MFQYISGSPEGIGAAENGLYFGSQDIHVKWFCNKIIGAAAHCHDHIHVIGSGGNKDDRYLRDPADFLTPVKTIVKMAASDPAGRAADRDGPIPV